VRPLRCRNAPELETKSTDAPWAAAWRNTVAKTKVPPVSPAAGRQPVVWETMYWRIATSAGGAMSAHAAGGGGGGSWPKFAETLRSVATFRSQAAAPLHAPPHPTKCQPADGVATSDRWVPASNDALHAVPQSMPAGVEVIRPEPVAVTATAKCVGPPLPPREFPRRRRPRIPTLHPRARSRRHRRTRRRAGKRRPGARQEIGAPWVLPASPRARWARATHGARDGRSPAGRTKAFQRGGGLIEPRSRSSSRAGR